MMRRRVRATQRNMCAACAPPLFPPLPSLLSPVSSFFLSHLEYALGIMCGIFPYVFEGGVFPVKAVERFGRVVVGMNDRLPDEGEENHHKVKRVRTDWRTNEREREERRKGRERQRKGEREKGWEKGREKGRERERGREKEREKERERKRENERVREREGGVVGRRVRSQQIKARTPSPHACVCARECLCARACARVPPCLSLSLSFDATSSSTSSSTCHPRVIGPAYLS